MTNVSKFLNLPELKDENGNNIFACTKKCYNQHQKILTTGICSNWDDDGRDGPLDPNNSKSIFVKWITGGDNFIQYHGYKNSGKKKDDYHRETANLINNAGVTKGEK